MRKQYTKPALYAESYELAEHISQGCAYVTNFGNQCPIVEAGVTFFTATPSCSADAISMFECGQGSCYGYAACFWALARGLGYEAEAFSGAIGGDMQSHAWVEIDFDGTVYIFDPETEAECIREGKTVRDMFMLHPDIALNWQYYKG